MAKRRGVAAALITVGALCLVMSWGGWQYLFRDYRDSPLLTYLVFGAFWTVIGAGLLLAGVRALRRTHHRA